MEVRYKRQQNKITSADTGIANQILENTSEDKGGEILLQLWKQECQRNESNTKKDFDCKIK